MAHKRELSGADIGAGKRVPSSTNECTVSVPDNAAPTALAEHVAAIRRSIEQLPPWHEETAALTQSLTKAVARRWFEHAYSRPDANHSGAEVQRGALQEQLNRALALFGIPGVGRRDPAWTWFLIEVVGVSSTHAKNGRAIRLCDQRSPRSFADTCQDLLQETHAHQQHH